MVMTCTTTQTPTPESLVDSALLNKIQSAYGLTISSSEKVTKGYLSENFILYDSAGRYFLKKYRFTNPRRVSEVHAAKCFFAQGGIPVILPLPCLDARTFFEHAGAYYTLFPFIEGGSFERHRLGDQAIVSFGQTLGKIHLLGKASKLPINDFFKIEADRTIQEKIEKILNLIEAITHPSDFDILALQNLRLKQNLLLENTTSIESLKLPADHLIHGDYLDHNVFFDENDTVQWVFDFEKTGYAPRTYELFRSMAYCILSSDFTATDFKKARLYLKSYREVYPLSDGEIESGLRLYFSKCIHGLWIEGEHYLKGNNRVDHFLAEEHKRIAYLAQNLDTMRDALLK